MTKTFDTSDAYFVKHSEEAQALGQGQYQGFVRSFGGGGAGGAAQFA